MHPLRRTILLFSALAIAGFTYVGTASATGQDLDCSDFATQEQAQAELAKDKSDPHRLDADGDRIACESRWSEEPAAPAEPTTPVPAGTPADKDCGDFATHDEAQAVYDADRSDPHGLDADNDDIACERLLGSAGNGTEGTTGDESDRQVTTHPVGGVDTGGLSE